jgi:hypothetical protein
MRRFSPRSSRWGTPQSPNCAGSGPTFVSSSLSSEHSARLRSSNTQPLYQRSCPAMMTIAEAAEMLRTSPRSLYQRIRRGVMPGVVRVGPRRLMVTTDEFLRELHRMPTFE